jgi:transposase
MSFIRKVKVGKHVYLQEVKSVWVNGKSRHKYVRTVGKEIDGKRVINSLSENLDITKITIYGQLLILHNLTEKLNLLENLGEYGKEILCMVYSHCIEPKSLNKMETWFSKTDLNHLLELPNITEKRLINALDSIDKDERIDYFQHKIYEIIKEKFDLKEDSFFYDITNIYFFGKTCPLSKRGKSKEGGFKKIIQIGLGVNKQGIPIFHKTFKGDVFDSKTLFEIMKHISEFPQIKETFLVWDRGVTSKINISDARKLGFQVLCGIKCHEGIKKDTDKFLDERKIIKEGERVQLKSCSFYVKKRKYNYENTKGWIFICLNRKQKIELEEKRLRKIHTAKEALIKGKKIDPKMNKYFFENENINKEKITEEEKYDGISFIFSTKDISPQIAVKKYFEKDIVEKSIASIKGVVKVRPIRKWLESRVKAHIFICYVAYLLLSVLNLQLIKKGLNFSVVETMEIMETMYKAYLKDKSGNVFTKVVTTTTNQEKILKAVDKKLLEHSN